jgi:hypothetical protein
MYYVWIIMQAIMIDWNQLLHVGAFCVLPTSVFKECLGFALAQQAGLHLSSGPHHITHMTIPPDAPLFVHHQLLLLI